MKKDGDERLKGTTLGMEKLFKHLFNSDLPGKFDTTLQIFDLLCNFAGAHRALADVRAMKAVFTHLDCLPNLQLRSPSQQLKLWTDQKMAHHRRTSLVKSLGKPSISAPQAKRLDHLDLSFETLLLLHTKSDDGDVFSETLKAKGVHSKPLRAKLTKLLGSKAPTNQADTTAPTTT